MLLDNSLPYTSLDMFLCDPDGPTDGCPLCALLCQLIRDLVSSIPTCPVTHISLTRPRVRIWQPQTNHEVVLGAMVALMAV